MNKRISELAEQSMVTTGVEGLGGSYNELDKEKFAMLILEEVMQELFINGYEDAFDFLNEHFGFEE